MAERGEMRISSTDNLTKPQGTQPVSEAHLEKPTRGPRYSAVFKVSAAGGMGHNGSSTVWWWRNENQTRLSAELAAPQAAPA